MGQGHVNKTYQGTSTDFTNKSLWHEPAEILHSNIVLDLIINALNVHKQRRN